jgi:hypothetical protein
MNKPWKNNKQLKRLCINMLIFYQTVIHTCCIKLVISCSLNPQSHVALPARDKTTFHLKKLKEISLCEKFRLEIRPHFIGP